MKLLSHRIHGFVDYVLVALLTLAPMALRFDSAPATVCYVVAGVLLVLSLLTAYPLGASGLVPIQVHGAIEFSLGVILLASPWLFGFAEAMVPRYFVVLTALAVVLLFLLSSSSPTTVSGRQPYDRYGE